MIERFLQTTAIFTAHVCNARNVARILNRGKAQSDFDRLVLQRVARVHGKSEAYGNAIRVGQSERHPTGAHRFIVVFVCIQLLYAVGIGRRALARQVRRRLCRLLGSDRLFNRLEEIALVLIEQRERRIVFYRDIAFVL